MYQLYDSLYIVLSSYTYTAALDGKTDDPGPAAEGEILRPRDGSYTGWGEHV